MVLWPHSLWAQKLSEFKTSNTESGPIIEFIQGEFILSDGIKNPNIGWKSLKNPNIYQRADTGWKVGDYHSLKGRFYFDREELNDDPLAIYVISVRNRFTVTLNGREIFRNFAMVTDQKVSWNRPFLIPLEKGILKQGLNKIVINTISQNSVGIGRVLVGPNVALQKYYDQQFFWRITAPQAANSAMLLIGMLVFLFWLGRRKETELLWLSISTILLFTRTYYYYADTVPYDLELFLAISDYSIYFSCIATAAFYFYFIKLPHRFAIITILTILAIITLVLLIADVRSLIFYIPTLIVVFGMAMLGFIDLIRYRNIERGVLGFIMFLMFFVIMYDFILAAQYEGDGSAIYISVFGGAIYTTGFLISFGKRSLDAFMNIEKSNIVLEQHITETRAELAASEADRQRLVIKEAITDERSRLMQEMHDGIGSNLITALAIARNKNQSETTIKTLNRAIKDLKITVDSLEPIEGDLVVLIGNLRHRMTQDIEDAGITCKWKVEDCEPLPWLDATNALHVLRIYQEAISNVMTHSGATEILIGCKEACHRNETGVTSYIIDNGCGFDPSLQAQGKGITNIQSRAESLNGVLNYDTDIGVGTAITLWLPYNK